MPAEDSSCSKVIRILLADDHEVVRRGFRAMIAGKTGWEVCAETDNGRTAVSLAEKLRPDVAVLDFAMPGLNGIEATRQIRKVALECEVIILSASAADRTIQHSLEAGARSFVAKTDAPEHLIAAIEAVSQAKAYFTPRMSDLLFSRYVNSRPVMAAAGDPGYGITGREREVLQLLAEGKSSKEVAIALGISERTAETHRLSLMRKLDLHSIADVVRFAIRHNIIEA